MTYRTSVLVSTDSVGVFGWKTLRATVFGDEGLSENIGGISSRRHSLCMRCFFSEQWTFTSADPLNSTYMLILLKNIAVRTVMARAAIPLLGRKRLVRCPSFLKSFLLPHQDDHQERLPTRK